MKLNQLLAVESSTKSRAKSSIDTAYKQIKAPALFGGLSRVWSASEADYEGVFPDESKKVQLRVEEVLHRAACAWKSLVDVEMTKDTANTQAKANVVVDGAVLVEDAPVTFLLAFEKLLTDVRTMIQHTPTLATEHEWAEDTVATLWRSQESKVVKTKKVEKPLVLYEATEQHPAQVKTVTEDTPIGYWHTVVLSGAVPEKRKSELLERVEKLQDAVKKAREEANSLPVEEKSVGDDVMSWLFA